MLFMVLKVTCRIQALLDFMYGSCIDLPVMLRSPKEPGEVSVDVDMEKYVLRETDAIGVYMLRRREHSDW